MTANDPARARGPPSRGPPARAPLAEPASVVVGTWNVSWWTPARFPPASSLQAQVLALQETKLAPLPLASAQRFLRPQGFTLLHGHPVAPSRSPSQGDSCGVAFLASPGVALSPLFPVGGPWRRLHSMSRVHAVSLPPRPGLPLGVRLFTVYAPLERDPVLEAFVPEFISMVASLDLQIPTLFMGDFNGSIDPDQDFNAGDRRPVSLLLTRLLGPGGPLLDAQLAVSPEDRDFTFRSFRVPPAARSRCDPLLDSHSALPLVTRVWVEAGVMDGGHSPVLASLRCTDWTLS